MDRSGMNFSNRMILAALARGNVDGEDITSNLEGHWPFDDTSASFTADSTANGNDLTLTGSVSRTTGIVGANALDMDGAFDRGNNASPAGLNITGDLTISCHVNLNSLPADQYIVVLYGGTNEVLAENENYRLAIMSTGALRLFWEYGSGSNVTADSTSTISASTNTHIAVTRTVGASSSVKFYIDKSPAETVGSLTNAAGGSSSTLWVGVDFALTAGRFFDGVLDDLRIYSRALTDAQIAALP